MSTELGLWDWRGGQIGAERLCAGILAINGYVDIDPQAPLGGPDGKKDILARRGGHKFVAAVYFPPTRVDFGDIRRKFVRDRADIERNHADGFVFLVNQPLTLGQRRELFDLGGPLDDVYHLERLRTSLDSPQGYGLRLEFLRQPMTVEEQIAFFSTLHQDLTRKFLENERRVEEKIDSLLHRTSSIARALGIDLDPSSLGTDVVGETDAPMARLDISTLQTIHRAVTEESSLPAQTRGQIRGVAVWIGPTHAEPVYYPPPPEEVPQRLAELLDWWRGAYALASRSASPETGVEAVSRLHYGILAIHPFLDGNGRVARVVADQAARELLKRSISVQLTADRTLYFGALRAADNGNLAELIALVRASLA